MNFTEALERAYELYDKTKIEYIEQSSLDHEKAKWYMRDNLDASLREALSATKSEKAAQLYGELKGMRKIITFFELFQYEEKTK